MPRLVLLLSLTLSSMAFVAGASWANDTRAAPLQMMTRVCASSDGATRSADACLNQRLAQACNLQCQAGYKCCSSTLGKQCCAPSTERGCTC